ncbi:MAG: selenide, water dikinase SelD [Anaerolineales bacterium]|nr:selenide, water dikinase SelD [Anaerolineales bacterium]
MTQVLRPIKDIFDSASYPDLIIGLDSPDDAAVWRLSDDKAIVVTTDFFTPVVDTAYEYGSIAAANSLSDVYAMGAVPFLALNIAALPDNLPAEISSEIIRGGAEKAREAGVVIAGGHTVKDKEPKYGLVAIGFVDPRKVISKSGLKVGDVLVLTKPLGGGVTTTALKQEKAEEGHVKEAIEWMSQLNKTASQLAVEFGVRGGTDITGFGLLGHGLEMAKASNVALHIEYSKLPFLSGARSYAEKGIFPGGAFDNKMHFGKAVKFSEKIDESAQMLLFDPQTSGGLLFGVARDKLAAFEERAQEMNQRVWVIGEVRAPFQGHTGLSVEIEA